MPSRKRAKGKARKAKARESNCNLILHNGNVCQHGCDIISKDDICYKFVEQLEVELNVVYESIKQISLSECFSATVDKLKASKEYDTIWEGGSEETQQKLQSLFINLGTNLLLRHDKQRSIDLACAAAVFHITSSHDFDYWEAIDFSRHRVSLRNMEDVLVYDIAKFFHKKISCQCLKEMYLQERSKPRLGECSYCKAAKDRRQLYLCSSCLYFHYCNVECQAGHWSKHKSVCKDYTPRNDCGL